MDQYFKDKTAKVVVVEPSGAARTLLVEVVRNLGFSDITGVPGLKEAISLAEVEPINWLITPLFGGQIENGLNVLKLNTTYDALRGMRVSFLLEESELDIIPDAFENGLLSYHARPFTKDSIGQEFKTLLQRYEEAGWNSTLTSAAYLRAYLLEHQQFAELLSFEKRLLQLFPSYSRQLFSLIAPLAYLKRYDEAKATLKQISLLMPEAENEIKAYARDYLDGHDLEEVHGGQVNVLDLKKVIVVDNDDAVRGNFIKLLQQMGVAEIQDFDNGAKALEFLTQNPDVDLVIQEWKIPGLNGPILIQRLHDADFCHIPIVLVSSLIQQKDMPLIREIGVANLIEKPCDHQEMVRKLVWTVQQDRGPTEKVSMERKIRSLLKAGKINEASELRTRYMADPKIPAGAKQAIEAEFFYATHDFQKARDFGLEALRNQGDTIFILNLLGKSMIRLGEFENALKCFEKAQSMAPQNIERLCEIAEVQTELGNSEAATAALEEAKSMDPDNERVKEEEAKVAINRGMTDEGKKIMQELQYLENVVAGMNNQAIAMARCRMVKEGVDKYERTLEAIPDSRPDVKGIVSYNLALAHLRAGQMEEAISALKDSVKHGEERIREKSKSVLRRVESAIAKGRVVQIQEAKDGPHGIGTDIQGKDSSVDESLDARAQGLVDLWPGDIACYKLFQPPQTSPKAMALMAESMRFNPRKAIERSESGGADRLLATSS